MKYFIDCEFLEGTQTKKFLGFNIGQTKPTIDLISIALVSGDGREYYAISKDFNLKEAWNRYDLKETEYTKGFGYETEIEVEKVYWIRENVLKPIWNELLSLHLNHPTVHHHFGYSDANAKWFTFSYKDLKWLINKYGKTNQQIAEEIKEFLYYPTFRSPTKYIDTSNWDIEYPKFYGYYSDYDWVAFCWLFGRMIDLPKGFPMYCIDLKQELDKEATLMSNGSIPNLYPYKFDEALKVIKSVESYPKQSDEHNALADARWNKKLYEFLKTF